MQNITISNKSPFFIKSNESTVFITDLGLSAIENLRQSYVSNNIANFAKIHKFFALQGEGSALDYYRATTRTYKNLPFFLQTFEIKKLGWDVFLENLSSSNIEKLILNTFQWYLKLGFKLEKIVVREDFNNAFTKTDLFSDILVAPTPTTSVIVECTISIMNNSFKINLFEEKKSSEKLDFMNKEGIRVAPFFGSITVFEDLAVVLNLLASYYSNTLPSEISPIKAVVLSVSEKWEQLASLVALKINSHVDNSSDAVGKKIRYWKSLGCSEIYVVGEKDMKELCETGKITLMKNSINSVMEPVVVSFI